MLENARNYEEEEAERKAESAYLKRLTFGFAIFVGIILMVAAGIALGATTMSVRTPDGDFITLRQAPCAIQSDWFKDWQKADLRYRGKDYEACWRVVGSTVLIMDSDGDVSQVPMQAFKQDTGV